MPELKPMTRYICPVGAGRYGHSSIYTGAYDVERLKRPSDGTCICGVDLVEESATKDGHRYRLVWESIDPHQAAGLEQRHGKGVWKQLDERTWDALSWHETSREADTPGEITAQHDTLLAWAESHEQPIRNVQLLQAMSPTLPAWEPA